MPEQDRARLRNAIEATAGWQGKSGRTLFHHSYVFIPAHHFLTFGFDRAMPYLYGFGNTLFHATLMSLAGGASISTYFSTFAAAEMFGIVSIGLLVLLITRNACAGLIGFVLSLAAFYSITYVPIFLAASFSPLRFFGLALQIAAMCLFCRSGRTSRFALLPLAAVASLFWNVEFALLGLPGQILLLLSPQVRLTIPMRALLLTALATGVVGFMLISRPSTDIVSTVQLSLFNIGMPFMSRRDVVDFLLAITSAQAALFALSFFFKGPERALRMALIPCLALLLIKFIVNPAAPHLYSVYAMIWPLCLIYLPWSKSPGLSGWTMPRLIAPALAIFVALFVHADGLQFKAQSEAFRNDLINDFKVSPWTGLGETIGFVTPEKGLQDRIASIKSRIQPKDTLVLLSPFDHVLNFYLNPRTLCGHFELLTNLATREVADKVMECATRSPQTLIVYDHATETQCPTDPLQTQSRCAVKFAMKSNLMDLKNRLLPYVELVGSDENLEFYRPKSLAAP